jgi:thiamine pyrophosphate-dependent acetolactate synthase large subunit-like protein
MCQAYSRLKQVPSVCMAASGPGVTNLITGVANALVDCCPVVSLGGSSPLGQFGRQVFQEIDQVELMRGCNKHVDRLINLKRIPQQINFALQKSIAGKPGPVYVDCPGDMLYQKIDETLVDWSYAGRPLMDSRPLGDPRQVAALVQALAEAKQPLIVSGTGVIWSRAWTEMQAFVEAAGIPFYTTPVLGVPRCRPDHRAWHADELHHRPCVAAALRAECEDRTHRHQPGGDRLGGTLCRYPDRRRLQDGAGTIARRHQGQGQRRQL